MLLKEQIEELKRESAGKIPEDAKKVMKKATEDLVKSGIEANIPKVGSKAYDFTLQNYDGSEVTLSKEAAKGPVVLSFYRGGWCPVCNLELNYLQSRLSDFQNHGANLIAVSPELPEYANETVERHNIEFPVLYDTDNKVAAKYGLVFKMPEDLVEVYEKFGLDVAKHNGNEKYEIPVPATFVVDRDLTLRYVFGKADYNQRAEPDDILEVLKGM
ncbi:MAG: AhpC/TSA family protein [Flexistipes sinusarabici]|uniref:thioredoxin-dependent peroxiredoxin n=1 Tax=Flexistipes sinusarabici TaxID=2352 RepID=A0A5D0MI16_FLESI|nr:peroxiredoxin-like family protein [Flexistipes sinusarabici]TYB33354.1 MAG: AhpC/TSA family protein [Flexistipes sinusarabici]